MSAPTKERSDAHLTESTRGPFIAHRIDWAASELRALCGAQPPGRPWRWAQGPAGHQECVVCEDLWRNRL